MAKPGVSNQRLMGHIRPSVDDFGVASAPPPRRPLLIGPSTPPPLTVMVKCAASGPNLKPSQTLTSAQEKHPSMLGEPYGEGQEKLPSYF